MIDRTSFENAKIFIEKTNEYLSDNLKEEVMTLTQGWEQTGFNKGVRLGREEGKREGLQEGEKAGQAAILLRQLQFRFGTVSSQYQTLIEMANSEKLLELSERLFSATTIDEIFASGE